MVIQGENYAVDVDGHKVIITGVMRLNGTEEYKKVLDVFYRVSDENNGKVLIDLSGLKLLNSSGITALSKFAIHCRKNTLNLSIKWNSSVAWQAHSVKNLQRLLPTIELIK